MKSGLPIVRLQFPTLNWRRTLYREIPEPIGRPMRSPTERVDVLIIGAGQSGLTMGRELLARGVSVRIVDENDRIGAAWRKRWNGLRLFSTRSYSSLPGYFMCGDPEGYPDKDEFADYLDSYATRMSAALRLGERVTRLRSSETGFLAELAGGGKALAHAVVIATGPFQKPTVPKELSSGLPESVRQIHVAEFDPTALHPGRTLVVGGGASGRQISHMLAQDREVWLSTRSPVTVQPRRLLGIDIMRWMDCLGFLWAKPSSLRGWLASRVEAFPGREYSNRGLKREGVRLVGAAVSSMDGRLKFSCGAASAFTNVVWATGYEIDDSWIDIPGAKSAGVGDHDAGISPVAGLFYIGRPFQTCRGSALICGVGRDAKLIADAVLAHLHADLR